MKHHVFYKIPCLLLMIFIQLSISTSSCSVNLFSTPIKVTPPNMRRGKKLSLNDGPEEHNGTDGDAPPEDDNPNRSTQKRSNEYQNLLECIAISDESEEDDASAESSDGEDETSTLSTSNPEQPQTKAVHLQLDGGSIQIPPKEATATSAKCIDTDQSKYVQGEKLPLHPPVVLTKDKIRELIDTVVRSKNAQNNPSNSAALFTDGLSTENNIANSGEGTPGARGVKRKHTASVAIQTESVEHVDESWKQSKEGEEELKRIFEYL